jgi:hypothetical protein
MDYLMNRNIHFQKRKKNNLPNPQKFPVYCAGQTHTPLLHGLLQQQKTKHLNNKFQKK